MILEKIPAVSRLKEKKKKTTKRKPHTAALSQGAGAQLLHGAAPTASRLAAVHRSPAVRWRGSEALPQRHPSATRRPPPQGKPCCPKEPSLRLPPGPAGTSIAARAGSPPHLHGGTGRASAVTGSTAAVRHGPSLVYNQGRHL